MTAYDPADHPIFSVIIALEFKCFSSHNQKNKKQLKSDVSFPYQFLRNKSLNSKSIYTFSGKYNIWKNSEEILRKKSKIKSHISDILDKILRKKITQHRKSTFFAKLSENQKHLYLTFVLKLSTIIQGNSQKVKKNGY